MRHIKSKHSAKHSTVAQEIAIESKNKKRRIDDVNWGEEELSSTDLDNLIPMVEVEKEKSQVGGDLWEKMMLNLKHKSKK